MAMDVKGLNELVKNFENLRAIDRNKIVANAVKQGADILLQSQKMELSSTNLFPDVVDVTKAKARQGRIAYKIGMQRGGKAFSDPSHPDFNKYRANWFQYWGFVTLKKWDKSKRKHPNKKYPTRATKLYHPPDLWLDRAFDKDIDKANEAIENALLQAMRNIK